MVCAQGRLKRYESLRERLRSHCNICAKTQFPRAQRLGTTDISRKASIRASRGGWVLKSEVTEPPPKRGFTMHSDDVDCEIAVVGIRLLYAPSFCKALISPNWLPTMRAPVASAANSRWRERANCNSIAARGARIISAKSTTTPPPLRSSRSPPPNQRPQCAIQVMAPASVAAMELIKIS